VGRTVKLCDARPDGFADVAVVFGHQIHLRCRRAEVRAAVQIIQTRREPPGPQVHIRSNEELVVVGRLHDLIEMPRLIAVLGLHDVQHVADVGLVAPRLSRVPAHREAGRRRLPGAFDIREKENAVADQRSTQTSSELMTAERANPCRLRSDDRWNRATRFDVCPKP
jgi:hypothetical protein